MRSNPVMGHEAEVSVTVDDSRDNSPGFKYEPLTEENLIRVIALNPGKGQDPLSCSMRNVSLYPIPGFEALSYVWGNLSRTSTIICNGLSLGITENLREALCAIRDPKEERYLWVDAICIDQENISERNHQVGKMGSIYSQAWNVLIWLGPDEPGEARSMFRFIQWLGTPVKKRNFHNMWQHQHNIELLKKLTCSEWFNRIWTMQEIGLAKNATVLYGYETIPWLTLVEACSRLHEESTVEQLRSISFNPESVIFLDKWEEDERHYQMTFPEVLDAAQSRNSSDARDRIFGLLGHPSARKESWSTDGQTIISADYSLSLNQVYFQTAIRTIQHMRNLDLLSFVRYPSFDNDIPSWVPLWHSRKYCNRILKPRHRGSACKSLVASLVGQDFSKKKLALEKRLRTSFSEIVYHPNGTISLHATWLGEICWRGARPLRESRLSSAGQSRETSRPAFNASIPREWGTLSKILARYSEKPRYELIYLVSKALAVGPMNPRYSGPKGHSIFVDESIAYWRVEDSTSYRKYCKSRSKGELAEIPNHFRTLDQERMIALKNDEQAKNFEEATQYMCEGRSLFITDKGFIGLGPYFLDVGDQVAILPSGRLPYVLRPQASEGEYKLVGECYMPEAFEASSKLAGCPYDKIILT